MIITEYMENGSLDAFLRVSHAFLSPHTRVHACLCINADPMLSTKFTSVGSQTFALCPSHLSSRFSPDNEVETGETLCFSGSQHYRSTIHLNQLHSEGEMWNGVDFL